MQSATRPPSTDPPTRPSDRNGHPEPARFRHLLTRRVRVDGRVVASGRSAGPCRADQVRPLFGRESSVDPWRFWWGLRKHPAAVGISTSWPEVPIRESVVPVTAYDGSFFQYRGRRLCTLRMASADVGGWPE
jgi:hypothetical protein